MDMKSSEVCCMSYTTSGLVLLHVPGGHVSHGKRTGWCGPSSYIWL